MALTIHQLALRLAKHIGVTAFDPGAPSKTHPLVQAGLRGGDLEDVVTCINGALQEIWEFAPRALRALYPERCPVLTPAEVGAVQDSGTTLLLPEGWEESVLLPLALRRLSTHPDFQPGAAKGEMERQAVLALRILRGLSGECPMARLATPFR